ncbi:MAG TPA: DUF835 domain-containing protein [Candidatus Altiarchaeales archaeon]|nr:DUF835 domain-containing protein [Candidatus Altiarchaeales archaeon]
MLHLVNDFITVSGSILIIPVDPFILDEKEMHLLKRDMKMLWTF